MRRGGSAGAKAGQGVSDALSAVRARKRDGEPATAASSRSLTPSRKPRKRKTTTDTSGSFQAALLVSMSEKAFQAHVVGALRARGWIVWTVPDMTRTTAGLPDVIAVHPTRVPRRVLFYELKTQSGRLRPEQRVVLAALGDVYGVDARVIRPADWPATLEDL